MDIMKEAAAIQEELVCHRRYLHQHPEIHDDLPVTTEYVMKQLTAMGYEPKEICKSGVVAMVGKKPGKTILLRADMDGLPVVEETGLEFKSCNNFMHACGHDMHAAMLLGAAKILKEHEDEIEGQVKLMFQPAEETMFGAKSMVEAGVLENPTVDAALASHVFGRQLPRFISVHAGATMTSSDVFRITIQGKGCHGATPEVGIDPINVGSHIVLAIQTINARENRGINPLVITIGKFQGGNASNIIPDKVILEGTIRTFNPEVRAMAKRRVQEIVEKTADTFNATAQLEFLYGAPPLMIDKNLLDTVSVYANEIFSEEEYNYADLMFMGSEDFSYVSEKVPSVYFFISGPVQEVPYPQHHPKVDFDETVMSKGMALMVHCALQWLKNN